MQKRHMVETIFQQKMIQISGDLIALPLMLVSETLLKGKKLQIYRKKQI